MWRQCHEIMHSHLMFPAELSDLISQAILLQFPQTYKHLVSTVLAFLPWLIILQQAKDRNLMKE